VVRRTVSRAELRGALLKRLPFEAELMICTAREVLDLLSGSRFPDPLGAGVTRYVSVLARRPRTPPPLPLLVPAGAPWQVKVLGLAGRFALSLHRRLGRSLLYPNEVVEKQFGLSATTRNWSTISTLGELLA
jgi:uncharacterized protein (DUF1697 family)